MLFASAAPVAAAVLDDALTVLRFGVPEEHRPNAAVLHEACSSIQNYLDSLNSAFIGPADDVPPTPDLHRLRGAGIPTLVDDEFAEALEGLEECRRMLLGAIRADQWPWEG